MDLALKDFDAALKIKPDDADIYYNRAVVYSAKGEEQKAKEDFQKAAEMGHNKARQYLKLPPSKPKTSSPTPKTSSAETPATTASGKIHGKNFTVEKATIQNDILILRQGKDFFADLEVIIFLFLKKGEELQGKVYNISKDQKSWAPHIHMRWKEGGKNLPVPKIFTSGYAMRLEFGNKENGTLPGRISLSLPDEFESFISGAFKAEVK